MDALVHTNETVSRVYGVLSVAVSCVAFLYIFYMAVRSFVFKKKKYQILPDYAADGMPLHGGDPTSDSTAAQYAQNDKDMLPAGEYSKISVKGENAVNGAIGSVPAADMRQEHLASAAGGSSWEAYVDEESDATYYYNSATNETTWDPPKQEQAPGTMAPGHTADVTEEIINLKSDELPKSDGKELSKATTLPPEDARVPHENFAVPSRSRASKLKLAPVPVPTSFASSVASLSSRVAEYSGRLTGAGTPTEGSRRSYRKVGDSPTLPTKNEDSGPPSYRSSGADVFARRRKMFEQSTDNMLINQTLLPSIVKQDEKQDDNPFAA